MTVGVTSNVLIDYNIFSKCLFHTLGVNTASTILFDLSPVSNYVEKYAEVKQLDKKLVEHLLEQNPDTVVVFWGGNDGRTKKLIQESRDKGIKTFVHYININ